MPAMTSQTKSSSQRESSQPPQPSPQLPPLPPPPPPPPIAGPVFSLIYPDAGQRLKRSSLIFQSIKNSGRQNVGVKIPDSQVPTDPASFAWTACRFYWYYLTQLLNLDDNRTVLLSFYNHSPSILQTGPTCGLVSLAMCLQLFSKDKFDVDLNFMFEHAKSLGYTRFGEMFSVNSMANLAKSLYPIEAEIETDMQVHLKRIAEHLFSGNALCVPYDSDANSEPALKYGHAAHWSAILGFCIAIDRHEVLNIDGQFVNVENPCLVYLRDSQPFPKKLAQLIENKNYKKAFLYAREGHSSRLHLWEFEKLCLSNCNLSQANPLYNQMYNLNDNNLNDLKNQFLFIKNPLNYNDSGK